MLFGAAGPSELTAPSGGADTPEPVRRFLSRLAGAFVADTPASGPGVLLSPGLLACLTER
jgi:hypothetical protein